MKPRHALMAAGLVGAGALAIFGDGAPAPEADTTARPALALPTQARTSQGTNGATAAPAAVRALRPRDGPDDAPMAGLQPLFPPQTWEAAAPASAAAQPPAAMPPPQAADSAPALPFVYIGRRAAANQLEIYLAEGELVHVVRPPALLGSLYRVDAAQADAIDFTYLPLNQTQRLLTPAAAP